MEGVGQIMNPGVVLSVAQAPIVEAPSMAVGPSMEGMQPALSIPEVAKSGGVSRFGEEAGERKEVAQNILDVAKNEGYDAAFERMAGGNFEKMPQEEFVEEGLELLQDKTGLEKQPEEMDARVQALENRVSALLNENIGLRKDIAVMKDLYAFTLEELLAFAILLRKRLEGKTEEDRGLIDILFSLIGKLFQAMVEPEVITGEEAREKAQNKAA